MPELPEVEAARRRVERAAGGRRIRSAEAVHDPVVFRGIPAKRFAAALAGRRVDAVRRRGKHLWLELDRRPWLALHFGMSGGLRIYRRESDRPRFLKMELVTDRGVHVGYKDARRFGRVRLQQDPLHEPPISRLGFDPLLDLPSAGRLAALLARRKAPLKAVLLDQSVFAGVGNWVADEVLYQAGLSPHRPASSLAPAEVRRLRARLRSVILKAVAVEADSDRFPRTWLFHHRWGKNAHAETFRRERIVHHTVGGRTTAWVPGKQR
jgi:formamidopyrimidine-DNA glycosylase